jgi:gamma-glutamyltranspeptidase/glutathione hydrolase
VQDFAEHRGEWVPMEGEAGRRLLNTTYRGRYRVFELPPNPGGLATLEMLNVLDEFDMEALGHNSADYLHVSIEAKKLAWADR